MVFGEVVVVNGWQVEQVHVVLDCPEYSTV